MDSGESIQVSVRAQFVTFDLPALAQTCNVTQFNGYDACPDCMAHGTPIHRAPDLLSIIAHIVSTEDR